MQLTLSENWDAGNLSSYKFRHKLVKEDDADVISEHLSPEWTVTHLNLDPCSVVTTTVVTVPDYATD